MACDMSTSVGCQVVVTSVTCYCSVVADLSVSRSVHATEMEPCCPDPFRLSSSECRAVHYGLCSSLSKLPTFLTLDGDSKEVNDSEMIKDLESCHLHEELPTRRRCTPPSSSSFSDYNCEKGQSDLAPVMKSIENNVKPHHTTFPAETGEESIDELARSLQYHLGNFLNAFRQQQKSSDVDVPDLNTALEESKPVSPYFPPYCSAVDPEIKESVQSKKRFPVNQDKIQPQNFPLRVETDELKNGLNDSDFDLLTKHQKASYLNRDREGNSSTYPDPLPAKNHIENYTSVCNTVVQNVNQEDRSKSPKSSNLGCKTSEPDDSEILDSLISLMNVSLTGLSRNEPVSSKDIRKRELKSGKSFVENPTFTMGSDFSSDVKTQEDAFCRVKDAKALMNGTYQNNRYIKNTQSPADFNSGNRTTPVTNSKSPKSVDVAITKDLQRNVNVSHHSPKVIDHDSWKSSGKEESRRSTPSVRQGDCLPLAPLSDTRRVIRWRDRCSPSTDYQNLLTSTKASVAERVMAFEKCPSWNIERLSGPRSFMYQPAIKMAKEPEAPQRNLLGNHSAPLRSSLIKSYRPTVPIPQFYFPLGSPPSAENFGAQLDKVRSVFQTAGGSFTKDKFHVVTKVCSLPLYLKLPLYLSVGSNERNCVTMDRFLNYWKRLLSTYHDDASRFVYILSLGRRPFLLHEDFQPMIQDIIDTHPGLTFLRSSKEFHSRYIDTVIARIYYNVNRSWSGRITPQELKKSNFLQIVASLEDEDDINHMMDYFSYEHFYVIYCKFWKIDLDHDLLISRMDLRRHNNGDISTRMIERIFSGAVTKGQAQKSHFMRYTDFVWFLLSEEDKRHERSIEYWFRCMDLDGDGFLSMYELEYFYEEQMQRMEFLGIEALPFKDCLCQMLDMVRPKIPEKISLSDLKNCKMTTLFFDTFFNLGKYLEHEQRDPFACAKESDNHSQELSDWCRYAEEEYNFLVSQENNPQCHSDSRSNKTTKTVSQNADHDVAKEVFSHTDFNSSAFNKCFVDDDDDDYDYADSDADY